MLMLLTLLVLGMVWVASAIVDNNKASRESLYGERASFLPTLHAERLFGWLMGPCQEQLYSSEVGITSIRLTFPNDGLQPKSNLYKCSAGPMQ